MDILKSTSGGAVLGAIVGGAGASVLQIGEPVCVFAGLALGGLTGLAYQKFRHH